MSMRSKLMSKGSDPVVAGAAGEHLMLAYWQIWHFQSDAFRPFVMPRAPELERIASLRANAVVQAQML